MKQKSASNPTASERLAKTFVVRHVISILKKIKLVTVILYHFKFFNLMISTY